MVKPIAPPPHKDPQQRTRSAMLPPRDRSRAALKMAANAAHGEFALQHCAQCDELIYPPRDACPSCLATQLTFQRTDNHAELIAQTTIQTTTDTYFRERMPWRIGTVLLRYHNQRLPLTVHLHDEVTAPCAVILQSFLDKTGNVVLMAMPQKPKQHAEDDPQLRELTATPKHRRVLVTDIRSAVGQSITRAVLDAGAHLVFGGNATPWLPFEGEQQINQHTDIHLVPLDITDENSVRVQAAEIGGKCDILINTAEHVRSGGVLSRQGVITSRDEFDVNVFGLQRLAQHFGPSMMARAADGDNSAVALVDILSVYALCNWGEYGAHSASAAARHSVLQCLRGELSGAGVRVMSIFTGPVDDDWRQPLPPPKLAPAAIARAIVHALNNGIEETFVGDIAKDVLAKWRDNAKALERELAHAR